MMRHGWLRSRPWLALMLLAVFLPAASLADDTFGLVSAEGAVNLRAQPGTDQELLGQYEPGSWVQILAENGDWYQIVGPDGKSGFMSSLYVQPGLDNMGTIGIVANSDADSYLNLRAAPGTTARILGHFRNGVPCILLGLENGWYHVNVNGVEGYFSADFIRQQAMAYSETLATISTPVSGGLNLRSGPGTQYPIITQFSNGACVMVLQQGKDWWRVSCQGYVGFMDASYLKPGVYRLDGVSAFLDDVQSTSSPAPTASPLAAQLTLAPNSPYAIVTSPQSYQVLNMRAQPNTDAAVVDQYANGTRIAVVRQGAEWCMVSNDQHVIGYMDTNFLTLYNLPASPLARVDHPQHSYVRLRSLPARNDGEITASVPHGAPVTVLIPGETWTKVSYEGKPGYIMTQFLKY